MGVNVAACHQARLVPVALEAHGLLQKVDIHEAGCWRVPSVAQRRSWRRSIQLLPAVHAVNSGRRGGGGDLDLREAENLEGVTVLGGSGDQLNKKHLLQAEGVTASSGDENRKLENAAISTPEVSHEQKLTVRNYIEEVAYFLQCGDGGGAPRWFSPLLPAPPTNAPILLFLPGMDGTGLGLLLHHESLARLFELWCLHIPVHDRTPFTGLVKLVEDTVIEETKRRPQSPIYLVGDSLGAVLALAVAARNPELDLVLILSNPATSFDRSQLQLLFPFLQNTLPSTLSTVAPLLLSFTLGDPLKFAQGRVNDNASILQKAEQLCTSLFPLFPLLPKLLEILPPEMLGWKLSMLHTAALYTNSRIHAVRAEVLVLASGNDLVLPSIDEAERLKKIIPGCRVRFFRENGHLLFLEGDFNLATLIRSTGSYRRKHKHDPVNDFVMFTRDEFQTLIYNHQLSSFMRQVTSPVFFSTAEDGGVIQGLSNIPTDRPVMLVGYHMFLGLELGILVAEFWKETGILPRGLAHPIGVGKMYEDFVPDRAMGDPARLGGAVSVSGKAMFQLLKSGASVLLFPGGQREAGHRKGETYKLFWPEKAEFVRMAARYGVTIIPFASVGEDELLEILVDANEIRSVPFLKNLLMVKDVPPLRTNFTGEVADQPLVAPIMAPKLPGRFYFKFMKPIRTHDRREELQQKDEADRLYHHVKREVENGLAYLQEKRKEDPYREFVPRVLYESISGMKNKAPTFIPE
ncbi:hypothetical protein BDL97_14G050300 [Sphagnum fallax]|nr:hypothetical protein BDL97_14G050300 [Sphagnum fallax]KAH8941596.1 hypothetical protein BDL97_14G050300 [Sphagnum fallax]